MENPSGTTDFDNGTRIRQASALYYVAIIAKRKHLVMRSMIATFIGCLILFWLILPRWYKSTAVVLPPKQKSTMGLLGQISKATSSLRSLGLGQSSDDLAEFQTILASRRVLEAVVKEFDLQSVYDVDTLEKAIKQLEGNIEFTTGKEDVSVEIVTYDTSPERSAKMANFFVSELDRVYREISASEARANREFLEKRYQQNLSDLARAEDNFRDFQQEYSVYSIPDQVKGAVQAAAAIQSQIALKEVQLGILSKTTSSDNPSREVVQLELTELRKQLSTMKSGTKNSDFQIFAPFDKAPKIGIEYLRRYRELELQGKILELLMPLYEQAKIEEHRDTPSVLVLDRAMPAVKAAKPKRAILTLVFTLGSGVLGFLLALFAESTARFRAGQSEEEKNEMAMIKRELHWRKILR